MRLLDRTSAADLQLAIHEALERDVPHPNAVRLALEHRRKQRGDALVLHQQAIDTTTAAGRMFFQVTGAFAEFERAMIRSRVKAGLERAKARGVRLGRPKTGAKAEAAIRARLARGDGIKNVTKALGVGNGTVARIKVAMAI
jgi:DNA invertase Pin-like site-specific DNA recombinase